jgi:hypothetical protein
LFIERHGARADLVRFSDGPTLGDRAICLAIINDRKRQSLIKELQNVDFAGPLGRGYEAWKSLPNYLGEWSKQYLYDYLTDYASMVLLSRSEVGTALVLCDALMAGLGLVVSEANGAKLA